ncbi:MAG: benzoate/H(+) symporter BenE family transporter [Hyphomicrobiaceae bacterium]|nr:benzoate/H(+) symporter BenE family transporter [Hyphomicrobiaceae bacterium]
MHLEHPHDPPAGLGALLKDVSGTSVGNALVGFVFAASGPVAIILAVGTRGGLTEIEIASWLFGAFFLNSLITIAFSLAYRQPLVFFWTIPGTVLVGPALAHLTFPEVVGAFIVTGALMLVLGLTGLVRRSMQAVPMPIVMGMVAGVFLQFGLDWVRAFEQKFWIAAPMTLVFLALTRARRVALAVPPLIGSLAVGIAVSAWTGDFAPAVDFGSALAAPQIVVPDFSWQAIAELVVPLAITVLVVQNGQGFAVLTAAGHEPPINSIAAACGAGSIVAAFVGAVSTCLTGPVNAILSASGERERQYTGAVMVAVFALAFGLFSPLFTRLLLAAPAAFIATLAGLAMLKVLQTAFATAFQGRFGFGALVTFLITVSGVSVINIGAPFWGLVIGYAASRLLEPKDFRDAAP